LKQKIEQELSNQGEMGFWSVKRSETSRTTEVVVFEGGKNDGVKSGSRQIGVDGTAIIPEPCFQQIFNFLNNWF
jgi:hypothetical protein